MTHPVIPEIIRNPSGERLDFRHERASGAGHVADWLVILAHGVTGNLDRPVVVDTAAALNAAGLDTLRFSFAGNGASDGDFREAVPSKETRDLAAVLDAVAPAYRNIAVAGHSMGAAVAVMLAADDPRIAALVSLAGMVDTRHFAETEFGAIPPEEGCMWDEPGCPLSHAFMTDLCQNIGTVLPYAHRIKIPWLLIHGTGDDVVLADDSKSVASECGERVELYLIEGADHSFSDPVHKESMTRRVAEWLLGMASR